MLGKPKTSTIKDLAHSSLLLQDVFSADQLDVLQREHDEETLQTRQREAAGLPEESPGVSMLAHDGQELTLRRVLEMPNSDDKNGYLAAFLKELASFREKQTFELATRQQVRDEGKTLLKLKCIFSKKFKPNGDFDKFKVRIVLQGHRMQYGRDYFASYSPTTEGRNLRMIVALATLFGGDLQVFDCPSAYLNSKMDVPVFCEFPPGFDVGDNEVLRVVGSLYGAVQAGRLWNKDLHKALTDFGLVRSEYDACIYFLWRGDQNYILLAIHVDDLLTLMSGALKQEFIIYMEGKYNIKCVGPLAGNGVLGIECEVTPTGLRLRQSQLIVKLAADAGLDTSNPVYTPIQALADVLRPASEEEERVYTKNINGVNVPYASLLGGLGFLLNTRPDLAFAFKVLGKNQQEPTERHWKQLLHCIKYCRTSAHLGLRFDKPNGDPEFKLTAYTDSDWAGDSDGRKSTAGYVNFVDGIPLSWSSVTIPAVGLSTFEVELMAASKGTKDSMGWRNLFKELGFGAAMMPTELYQDNESAKLHIEERRNSKMVRHVGINYFYARQMCERGEVHVKRVSSADNVADVFTKAVDRQTLERLRATFLV